MNIISEYIESIGFKYYGSLDSRMMYSKTSDNTDKGVYYITLDRKFNEVQFIYNQIIIYTAKLSLFNNEFLLESLRGIELGFVKESVQEQVIVNRKCIDELIKYEIESRKIELRNNDKFKFIILDGKIVVILDNYPVHLIDIVKEVRDILEKYPYNQKEDPKESRVKYMKTIFDEYVDKHYTIQNLIGKLKSIGFEYKTTINSEEYYSYRDRIRIKIKNDHVRLYLNQMNKFKRFEFTDTTLNDICDYIKNL